MSENRVTTLGDPLGPVSTGQKILAFLYFFAAHKSSLWPWKPLGFKALGTDHGYTA